MPTDHMTPPKPFLRIEGLQKTYPGNSEPVFDNVNFGIGRGEFVCIIGHSGCGKTTILNVLAGLESASGGHVFMDEREVGAPGLERWVAALSRLEHSFARAGGLHLEPKQTVLSAARDLSYVARNGAL